MNLRKQQKDCVDLLNNFDLFCKKHNLEYYLFYGSLLGAVRHKGFIPWDDDVDIVMTQTDFLKFIDLNSKKNDFKIHKFNLDNTGVLFQTGYLESKINNNAFIDVFVLMPVKKNWFKNKLIIINWKILFYIHNIQNNVNFFARKNNFFKKIAYYLIKPIRFLFKLFHIFEFVSLFKSYDENDFIGVNEDHYMVAYKTPKYFVLEKSIIYPLKKMKFENKEYPIPNDYHHILTRMYGDYMTYPKKKDRVPLHMKN